MSKIFTILFVFMSTLTAKAQFADYGSYSTTTDNIGIGVTNPTEKLEIAGKIKMDGQPSPRWNNSVSAYVLQSSHFYGHTKTEEMYIGESTNIVSVRGKLELGIDTRQHIKFLTGSNTSGYALEIGLNDDGVNISNNSSWRGFNFSNASGRLMTLQHNGNLGIGTTNPGSFKLAVEGKIGAREIQVKTGTWADYVFDEDYILADLSEVEQYIKENKHLSGIPTAAEVEKDGVNLGEMNVKLLEKVEELTLYIIELEKRIKSLEKK